MRGNWSVQEVCEYTGLTYRQLDFWVRRQFLKPARALPGSGTSRVWTSEELKVARKMAVLVEAGLTVEAAERAARNRGELAPGVRVLFPAQFSIGPPACVDEQRQEAA
jgi:DNA-binding transcriptional MerR regulator